MQNQVDGIWKTIAGALGGLVLGSFATATMSMYPFGVLSSHLAEGLIRQT